MRGRKPKPIARQIAEGDPRKVGKLKLEEQLELQAKATRGLPACPVHIRCVQPIVCLGVKRPKQRVCGICLNCRARATWEMWAEELAVMDLDHRPDAQMLEGACMAYEQAVDADCTIAREGSVVRYETLDPQTKERIEKMKAHPAVAISRSAWAQVKAFCSEFGLSPVSRQRLSLEAVRVEDREEEDLFSMLAQPRQRAQIPESVN